MCSCLNVHPISNTYYYDITLYLSKLNSIRFNISNHYFLSGWSLICYSFIVYHRFLSCLNVLLHEHTHIHKTGISKCIFHKNFFFHPTHIIHSPFGRMWFKEGEKDHILVIVCFFHILVVTYFHKHSIECQIMNNVYSFRVFFRLFFPMRKISRTLRVTERPFSIATQNSYWKYTTQSISR